MFDGAMGFYRLLMTGIVIVWLAVMGIIIAGMSIRTVWHNARSFIERLNSDK